MPLITVVPQSRYKTIDLINQGEITLTPSFTNYRYTNLFPVSLSKDAVVNYLALNSQDTLVKNVSMGSGSSYSLGSDIATLSSLATLRNGDVFTQSSEIVLNKPSALMGNADVFSFTNDIVLNKSNAIMGGGGVFNLTSDITPGSPFVVSGGAGEYSLSSPGIAVAPAVLMDDAPTSYPADRDTTDPYLYTNNVLLTDFEGANGSTSLTDAYGKLFSNRTGFSLSTTKSKFGSSSGYFNGATYLETPQSAQDYAFGVGDFTIEFWFNTPALPASVACLVDARDDRTGTNGFFAYYQSNGVFGVSVDGGATVYPTAIITANKWYHLAVVRNGGVLHTYINGNSIGSIEYKSNMTARSMVFGTVMTIKTGGSGWEFYGYMDALRVTKGVARYVHAFTPPTVPYPLP